MSRGEQSGQQRSVFGTELAECGLCGSMVPSVQLRATDSSSTLAEHDHVHWVCPACWERLHRGEIEIESLLMDEDESRGSGEQR